MAQPDTDADQRTGVGSPDQTAQHLCPAEAELWRWGVDDQEATARIAVRLATRLRKAAMAEGDAIGKLLEWNQRNRPRMSTGEVVRLVREAYRVDTPYRFPCPTVGELPPDLMWISRNCPYPHMGACEKDRLRRAAAG